MNRQTWSERLNAHLREARGEVFTRGKWRWWFPLVALLTALNGVLTAYIFSGWGQSNAVTLVTGIAVSLGGLLCWLAVACLHYSDCEDSRLARGVSMLDSVTLCFVIAHFCFLFWAFGHLITLRSTEADYKIAVEQFNAKAENVSRDNTEIARSAAERLDIPGTQGSGTGRKRRYCESKRGHLSLCPGYHTDRIAETYSTRRIASGVLDALGFVHPRVELRGVDPRSGDIDLHSQPLREVECAS
jgi:hypothetical protein